jgi:hypothetical protein
MKLLHGLVGMAVGLLSVSSARAAYLVETYQGVVADGSDLNGLFGAPGASLAGASFSATYVVNTPVSGATYQDSLFAAADISITINGRQVVLACETAVDYCQVALSKYAGAGGVWGVDSRFSSFSVDAVPFRPIELWNQTLNLGLTSSTDPFVVDSDLRAPFTHYFQPGDVATGGLEISDEVFPFPYPNADPPFYRQHVTATLMPLSFSVYVPEPAT